MKKLSKKILSLLLALSILFSQVYVLETNANSWNANGFKNYEGYVGKNISNRITWLDFSEFYQGTYTNGNLVQDKNLSLVDGKYLRETLNTPYYMKKGNYVLELSIKKLAPFETTDFFAKRVEAHVGTSGADYWSYVTKAKNRGNHRRGIFTKSSRVYVKEQSHLWSNLLNTCGVIAGGKSVIGTGRTGADIGILMNIKAYYLGEAIVPTALLASAESAGKNELEIYTTNGSPWELVAELSGKNTEKGYKTTQSYSPMLPKHMLRNIVMYPPKYWLNKNPDASNYEITVNGNNYGDGIGTHVFGPVWTEQGESADSIPLVMSKGDKDAGLEVGIYINAVGIQDTAFGVILYDLSDAGFDEANSASYGHPKHLVNTLPDYQQPYLGRTKADYDYDFMKGWEQDDKEGDANYPDEGAQYLLPAKADGTARLDYPAYVYGSDTYTLPVLASAGKTKINALKPDEYMDAYLRGYVDFSNLGHFYDEDKDAATLTYARNTEAIRVAGDLETKNVVFTGIKAEQSVEDVENKFKNQDFRMGARLRIASGEVSSAKAEVNSPTRLAFSGEVEDFLIPIQIPPVGKTTRVNVPKYPANTPVTDYVYLNAYGKDEKGFDNAISTEDEVVVLAADGSHLTGVDNADGTKTYTILGEGEYTVNTKADEDGKVRVSFLANSTFSGIGEGIAIRVKDNNANSTEWSYTNTSMNNTAFSTNDGLFIPTVDSSALTRFVYKDGVNSVDIVKEMSKNLPSGADYEANTAFGTSDELLSYLASHPEYVYDKAVLGSDGNFSKEKFDNKYEIAETSFEVEGSPAEQITPAGGKKSGTADGKNIELIHVFRKRNSLTVEYIDINTDEPIKAGIDGALVESEVSLMTNQAWDASGKEKTIAGYTFVKTKAISEDSSVAADALNGTSTKAVTVQYLYRKNRGVSTEYVVEDYGNVVVPNLSYASDSLATIRQAKDISSNVNNLAENVLMKELLTGGTYNKAEFLAKFNSKYAFDKTVLYKVNIDGTETEITEADITNDVNNLIKKVSVRHIYKARPFVKVEYVDEAGNALSGIDSDLAQSTDKGYDVNALAKYILGYQLLREGGKPKVHASSAPASSSSPIANEVTVKFVYIKQPLVIVKYVDKTGTPIPNVPSIIVESDPNKGYDVSSKIKEIPYYVLLEDAGSPDLYNGSDPISSGGNPITSEKTVIFQYEKRPIIFVNYVDVDEAEDSDERYIIGKNKAWIQTTKDGYDASDMIDDIDGYVLVKDNNDKPKLASGSAPIKRLSAVSNSDPLELKILYKKVESNDDNTDPNASTTTTTTTESESTTTTTEGNSNNASTENNSTTEAPASTAAETTRGNAVTAGERTTTTTEKTESSTSSTNSTEATTSTSESTAAEITSQSSGTSASTSAANIPVDTVEDGRVTKEPDVDGKAIGKLPVEDGGTIRLKREPSFGSVIIENDGSWEYIPDDAVARAGDAFMVSITNPDGEVMDIIVELVPKALPDTSGNMGLELKMLIGAMIMGLGLILVKREFKIKFR